MTKRVGDLKVPLEEYAVVDEDATVLDALKALQRSQEKLPPGRQPHRAVLVRDRQGEIMGKLHYFAFLRALVPEKSAEGSLALRDRAGVEEDLWDSSMRMLQFLTGDLMNRCERARFTPVRDILRPVTVSIREEASLSDAISAFLAHHTLSLLVTREGGRTVGILRLSDLFEELAREIMGAECQDERS